VSQKGQEGKRYDGVERTLLSAAFDFNLVHVPIAFRAEQDGEQASCLAQSRDLGLGVEDSPTSMPPSSTIVLFAFLSSEEYKGRRT
jgi:hypothetical protein